LLHLQRCRHADDGEMRRALKELAVCRGACRTQRYAGKDFIGAKVGREKVSEKLCCFHGSPAAWSFDSHLGIDREHRGGVISSRVRMAQAAAEVPRFRTC
jgi:hypothetical protein